MGSCSRSCASATGLCAEHLLREPRLPAATIAPPGAITGAQIISQTSNAACIQGRSWGWDRNGIWVNSGCAGDFAFQGGGLPPRPGPPIGTNSIACESRDYQQNFCGTGVRISRAWIAQQQSQAPCIQGRVVGLGPARHLGEPGLQRGLLVRRPAAAPPPPPMGSSIACESRNYQQSWCNTGRRVGRAWVAEQRSQSPCIQGQTWGWRDNAIWVNGGCSAIFAFDSR